MCEKEEGRKGGISEEIRRGGGGGVDWEVTWEERWEEMREEMREDMRKDMREDMREEHVGDVGGERMHVNCSALNPMRPKMYNRISLQRVELQRVEL